MYQLIKQLHSFTAYIVLAVLIASTLLSVILNIKNTLR